MAHATQAASNSRSELPPRGEKGLSAANTRRKRVSVAMYYMIGPDHTLGGPPGWRFENYETVQKDCQGIRSANGWPDGYLQLPRGPWRFPEYVETPRFRIDRKFGRPPRDVEGIDGFWIISAAMRAVLEAVDPEACEFRRCDTILANGAPGPERWLCSITRAFVGAVDPAASEYLRVSSGPGGRPAYSTSPATRIRLIPEVIGSAHLFHIAEMARAVWCDETVKQICKAASLKGIQFRKMAK